MQRREFLAATSGMLAAACVPALPIAGAAKPVDFSMFSAEYVGRKIDSSLPFIRDGWLFATDTRICIRQRTLAENTPRKADAKTLPSVWLAEWPTDEPSLSWRPWPNEMALFAALTERDEFEEACVRQRGRECPECLGDGCAKCHNWGGLIDPEDCWICGGIGINSFARISGRHIGNEFLRKITELLPGPIEYLDWGNSDDALAFRWNGGDGLVMPIEIRPTDKIRALSPEQTARVRSLPIKVYRDVEANDAD